MWFALIHNQPSEKLISNGALIFEDYLQVIIEELPQIAEGIILALKCKIFF